MWNLEHYIDFEKFCLQDSTEIALELNESEPKNGRSIDTRNFRPRVDSTNLTNVIKPNQNTFGNENCKRIKEKKSYGFDEQE